MKKNMGFYFFLLGIAVISQSKEFGNAEGREIVSSSHRYPAGSTGPLHALLYVSSSAPATDFFVRLIDVHPDGTPYPVFYTYANPYSTRGLETENTGPKGEKIWKCKIELPPTSNLFFKEHKIRIEICSAAFPLFRNLNMDYGLGLATEYNVARQIIFHDEKHPSYIVLPVIPRKN